jgi:cold shock CspA family protein
MPRGTIVRALDDKGCCWIQEDNGPEIFANRSKFQNTNISFHDIRGTRVEFSVSETNRGFECRNVQIIDDPAGRDYGTIKRLISGGGFIKRQGAPDQRIFFPLSELLGDGWPDDLIGIDVSYTVNTDPKSGRLRAVAIRNISTQG